MSDAFDDPTVESRIERRFLDTYLQDTDRAWLTSDAGRAEVHREIVGKYRDCVAYVLPWVQRHLDLAGKTVLEVGCGTGSKAAAFAGRAAHVYGCDISHPHLEAARARMHEMRLDNVSLWALPAESFLEDMTRRLPDGIDVCLLYAVLEHLTLSERLATLRAAWSLVRPGGLLVVAEVPNRLLPHDHHSSQLPFFNMLPEELALQYFERSPRQDFKDAVRSGLRQSHEAGLLALARQGRGVSYHEFELVLGSLEDQIVDDGYSADMLNMNGFHREEVALREFIARQRLSIPAGFTRYWLDLVFRKGGATPKLGYPRDPLALEHRNPARASSGPAGLLERGRALGHRLLDRVPGPAGSLSFTMQAQERELVVGFRDASHGPVQCRNTRGDVLAEWFREDGGRPRLYRELRFAGTQDMVALTGADLARAIQYLHVR